MSESWVPVDGYVDYEVSSEGRVRRRLKKRAGQFRYLKPIVGTSPYPRVSLFAGGRRNRCSVHALILEAFCGPRPAGYTANHKNGLKADNRAINLEWVTPSQNSRHAVANGLMRGRPGELTTSSTINDRDALVAYQLAGLRDWPLEEIARCFGVRPSVISRLNRGRSALLRDLGAEVDRDRRHYEHVRIVPAIRDQGRFVGFEGLRVLA